ncbi:MAG TPA: nucleotide exchange factor GrpE [Longimicrobiales bacterium]|nr:nucleotide exchange factor GrpE [Longimicrobiales bacterium]
MAERPREDDSPRREDPAVGAIADGDGQLDLEPLNVETAEPPAPGAREAASTDEVEALQRDYSALSDRHLRLAAEFDNYRKRNERERADSWTRAQGELAARMLDALDDLERVSHHADTSSADALLQGVQLVERKLKQALESAGLEPVDPEGERFDPNTMEAVAMVPAESHAEDDIVSDVFQRGYRFKGTLIRPARVRVKKHGA